VHIEGILSDSIPSLPAALRTAHSASNSVTQAIFMFFAPHVAPIGLKFGVEEKVDSDSSMPNFTSIGAEWGHGAPKLKILPKIS